MAVPVLSNLNKESWKYSNINGALKKLDVAKALPQWAISGAAPFIKADAPAGTLHIVIPKNTKVELPIDLILNGQRGQELVGVVNIDVASGAEMTFVEQQKGVGAYWKNITFNINVAENAVCRHYRLCEDDSTSVVTTYTNVILARNARYNMVTMSGCAGFGRSEYHIDMTGEGAEADLSGVALLRGKQHADTTIVVNHRAPHGRSSQFFKHILEGQSRGVFQGKIHVFKDAQKTNGYQLSNNLLLSPLAEMDVKPELEIYADDVKCSHGSTTGQLDETPMFYLMSRGISQEDARRLLIEAFLVEIVDKITIESVRTIFSERVRLWLT